MIGAVRGMESSMTWSSTVFLDTLVIWSFAAWPLGQDGQRFGCFLECRSLVCGKLSWIWHCTYSFIRGHVAFPLTVWSSKDDGIPQAGLFEADPRELHFCLCRAHTFQGTRIERSRVCWNHLWGLDSHGMIWHDSHRFPCRCRAGPASSGHACHANVLWRSLFHYRPCEECEVHYQCGWSLHADPGRAYESCFDKWGSVWMRLVCLVMSNKDGLMKHSWTVPTCRSD